MNKEQSALLTIAICTYNRPDELATCLRSLQQERSTSLNFKILVVDNYGCTQSHQLAVAYSADYVREEQTGLSLARNRAWRVCSTTWIMYLDDDAKVRPGFIAETCRTIDGNQFSVFGGRFEHWFKVPPPKWFPKEFEVNGRPNDAKELSPLPEGDFLFGGVIAFKRAVLEQIEGFNPAYGMRGKKLAYGEENEVQIRLRAKNFAIGYNPNIVIDHLVGLHKYHLTHHLRAAYQHGLSDAKKMLGESYSFLQFIHSILRTMFVRLPKGVAKLFMRKQYYWQNLLIEVVGYGIYFPYGRWRAANVK
ncbi:MAG: glycosyltransferase family 2 protein [Bacteroidota bacterium]